MKIVNGDLIKLALNGQFDVIIHGCNCYCTMGAGIAKAVKTQFPEAYAVDCETEKGSKNKLGTYSSASVTREGHSITIVNGYTQHHYRRVGGKGINADYDAIRAVFKAVRHDFSGKTIGYPRIGAGLAGGDWTIIADIINEELEGENHTLVEFSP
ncbi:macro domain-containing protein [Desulfuromonas acetoxidans]|uniref:macro domain-containing protein n=1 Tax=Desulfuromonas acetoxidans TaxID=891 RepID=UPI00292EFC56|nr:macro domain-containing protein [Desulfuromonas acetoxidans]